MGQPGMAGQPANNAGFGNQMNNQSNMFGQNRPAQQVNDPFGNL